MRNMRTDFWMDSCGAGKLHGCRWMPEGEPVAVVQILHGIAEFVERYDDFARYLVSLGYAVVAADHMGHGGSIEGGSVQGYFHGGWFAAAEDCYRLLQQTRREFPGKPYILFGHSMGSFLARTVLAKYPDSGISAAIICGTGWQPKALLSAGIPMCNAICKAKGEKVPSPALHKLIFGSYNKRVEHQRTANDWLTRDAAVVDAYNAHPLCGFVPSAGLLRDMMQGISYIQKQEALEAMEKNLPVFFIAGGDDPVGGYGEGVRQAAQAFRHVGMEQVAQKIYPLCRHEILNELNRREVYEDIRQWLEETVPAVRKEI